MMSHLAADVPPVAMTGPLVVEAHFLSDRVMASLKEDRTEPEWPLHPSRLFSAAVAALHSIGSHEAAFALGEAAVRWLESLGPPDVHAAAARMFPPVLAFVPANDEAILTRGKSAGLEACLPDSPRRRKGRQFPGVTVDVPVIRYSWQVNLDDLARHRTGLQHVISRIVYLGRSVNFALVRMLEIPPHELPMADRIEHWAPSTNGMPMRIVRPGRLDRLRELHDRGEAVDRGPYTFYRRSTENWDDEVVVKGPWSKLWTAFALPGIRADAADTEVVAKAIRRALNRSGMDAVLAAIDPALRATAVTVIDPFICGHESDGVPSRIERLAVVPLANILHEHADSRLLGFALLMPSTATPDQWRMVSEIVFGKDDPVLAPLSEIRLGQTTIEIKRTDQVRLKGLSSERYVAAARMWTTVTPILLARWPYSGRKRPDPAMEVDLVRAQVVKDCIDAGFPAPAAVEVSQVSHLDGVSDARAFKQCRNGPARWATHATITFQHPVNGPVLIGAGRYNGLGMLTPDPRDRASHQEEPE